jgi:hypothetical protein
MPDGLVRQHARALGSGPAVPGRNSGNARSRTWSGFPGCRAARAAGSITKPRSRTAKPEIGQRTARLQRGTLDSAGH